MARQIKVRTKLIVSFLLLVAFTGMVGYTGMNGIDKILYQQKISDLVNSSFGNAQNAQAASLRYVIYHDREYSERVIEKSKAVIKQAQEAEELMLSQKNKDSIEKLIAATDSYISMNRKIVEIQTEINAAASIRTETADGVLENTKAMIASGIDQIEKSQRGGLVSVSQVDRLLQLQEIRNSTNRFWRDAQAYQAANNDAEKESIYTRWIEEIEYNENMLIEARTMFSDSRTLSLLDHSLESISAYKENVGIYRELEQSMSQTMAITKENAGTVMKEAAGGRTL